MSKEKVEAINGDGFLRSVTPVKTGVQRVRSDLKELDSGFRRNDGKRDFRTVYEVSKLHYSTFLVRHSIFIEFISFGD
jgi:hypothetical protein